MTAIFLVEDDENITELVTYALRNSGFEVTSFDRSSTFFHALKSQRCDLVLLDVMLPQESGIDVLKRMKKDEYSEIPVIMLTAKTTEFDKIMGLDSGADDYITKPFSILELISRVKAVLRRYAKPEEEDELLTFQNIEMHVKKRKVYVEGVSCTLTFKEFELLQFMLRHPNVVLSREKILEIVWGFEFEGESRTVDMHVKSLRQKLGVAKAWIQTVRSIGYKIGD